MLKTIIGVALWMPVCALGSPKENFIKAVVEQCQLPQDKAEKLATTGRTGTIVLFVHCANPQLKVSDDCVVSCKKQSNHIGGYTARIRT